MAQRLRHVDLVARVGGDEFTLMPETNQQQARRVIDTLSAPLPVAVPSDRRGQAELTLHVHLSAGAATVPPTGTHGNVEDALAEPDRAMYEAKGNKSAGPAAARRRTVR